jgi:hypothetical protein
MFLFSQEIPNLVRHHVVLALVLQAWIQQDWTLTSLLPWQESTLSNE